MYNIIWPVMMAHCHLDRPTNEYLLKAGSWEKVEFFPFLDEKEFAVLPHICGRLVKSR